MYQHDWRSGMKTGFAYVCPWIVTVINNKNECHQQHVYVKQSWNKYLSIYLSIPHGPFLMPPSHGFMAQWSQNGFESSPHMGQGYSGRMGSLFEHNCVTDGKKSEKSCQKWPKMAKTMAIFCHKWLIKWQKKLFSSISSWQWLLVSFWSQSNIWKYLYRRPAS